jgi:DNA-binding CsgD family transcriptional regulator
MMRDVYALRLEASRIDSLTRLKVQLQNLSHSLRASRAEANVENVVNSLEKEITAAYALLRRHCLHCQPVAGVLRVLRQLFDNSDRAIYSLAIQIAPLERFSSSDALKRYCGLLKQSPESGGKTTQRAKWRGGNRRARVAMYQLLMSQIAVGNGKRGRGRWRDYYERLRQRMSHGEAMIRMMKRLCELLYKAYHSGSAEDILLIGEASLRRSSRKQQIQESVLELVAKGLTDYEVAKHLGIAQSTISVWKRRDEMFLQRYINAKIQSRAKEASPDEQHQ